MLTKHRISSPILATHTPPGHKTEIRLNPSDIFSILDLAPCFDPLILGLSAATLIEISMPDNTKFEVIAFIIVLIAGIGFLFWLKEHLTFKTEVNKTLNPSILQRLRDKAVHIAGDFKR